MQENESQKEKQPDEIVKVKPVDHFKIVVRDQNGNQQEILNKRG